MIGAAGPRLRPMGLAARIILFLSLALVPIGVVAYFQTTQLAEETRLRSQLSLVALTETAAVGERETILRAQGSAQALGAILAQQLDDPAACTRAITGYVAAAPTYAFAGVLTASGRMPCSSAGDSLDPGDYPRLRDLIRNPGPSAWLNRNGAITHQSVIVVAEPFYVEGELAGHVVLSMPSVLLPRSRAPKDGPQRFVDIVTINNNGEVMSARGGLDKVETLLPADLDLKSLVGARPQSFAARSADGQTRVYAASPLVPGMVHVVGIWRQDDDDAQAMTVSGLAVALPLAMWAASVVVAFLAVNRLVIRHIKRLSRRMRAFARSRHIPSTGADDRMPAELAEMENDFLDMADAILRDEAQQENALREKTILLKEVHHRVKNNLQLISSIMNMQIRQAHSGETRAVLHRLQDRVRSLATIHRNLYQTEDLGHVDAGKLLKELVEQMQQMTEVTGSRGRVQLSTDVEHLEAVPDQAVPLSLLTAEAMTNALKYATPGDDGVARVAVSLRRHEDGRAVLELKNSTGNGNGAHAEDFSAEPAGLGSKLIQAFATQLGGTLEQGLEGGFYRVRVAFTLIEFSPDETIPKGMPHDRDY